MGIASLVLGILGIIPLPIPFIGTLSALVGLVLGVLAKKKAVSEGTSTGVPTAGIVLCIVSIAISVLWAVACGSCAAAIGSSLY